jgi:hypothetical protein
MCKHLQSLSVGDTTKYYCNIRGTAYCKLSALQQAEYKILNDEICQLINKEN